MVRLNSVVEVKEMLAENLENWAKKERQEARREIACNLIQTTELDDITIAHATALPQGEITALRSEFEH